jgi:hypothetical protein
MVSASLGEIDEHCAIMGYKGVATAVQLLLFLCIECLAWWLKTVEMGAPSSPSFSSFPFPFLQ